ncbi:unnamed protein product, partial [Closterium sp. NIES-65]
VARSMILPASHAPLLSPSLPCLRSPLPLLSALPLLPTFPLLPPLAFLSLLPRPRPLCPPVFGPSTSLQLPISVVAVIAS